MRLFEAETVESVNFALNWGIFFCAFLPLLHLDKMRKRKARRKHKPAP